MSAKYKVTAKCFFDGKLLKAGESVVVDSAFEDIEKPSYLELVEEAKAPKTKTSKK
jgi:hypothetical protein